MIQTIIKLCVEKNGEDDLSKYVNYRRNIHIMKVNELVNCINNIENILAYLERNNKSRIEIWNIVAIVSVIFIVENNIKK